MTDLFATGEALAREFHERYERLAPQFGYETRKETRQFNAKSPNGRLMIAVCCEIVERASCIAELQERIERLEEGLNAIIDRGPERDIKWAGMTARDIARAALGRGE